MKSECGQASSILRHDLPACSGAHHRPFVGDRQGMTKAPEAVWTAPGANGPDQVRLGGRGHDGREPEEEDIRLIVRGVGGGHDRQQVLLVGTLLFEYADGSNLVHTLFTA